MIHRLLNGDVPSGNAQILKYRGKNRLFILFIHHKEGLWIPNHMAVFFQKTYTEAMKRSNSGQIPVWQLGTNPLLHLRGSLIGKGYTENIGRGNAQYIHKIQVSCRQGFCLSGARAGNHPDIALGRGGRLPLLWVQLLQIFHAFPSFLIFSIINHMFVNVHCLFRKYTFSSHENKIFQNLLQTAFPGGIIQKNLPGGNGHAVRFRQQLLLLLLF